MKADNGVPINQHMYHQDSNVNIDGGLDNTIQIDGVQLPIWNRTISSSEGRQRHRIRPPNFERQVSCGKRRIGMPY